MGYTRSVKTLVLWGVLQLLQVSQQGDLVDRRRRWPFSAAGLPLVGWAQGVRMFFGRFHPRRL